jgi:hypothetical protein
MYIVASELGLKGYNSVNFDLSAKDDSIRDYILEE